MWNLKQAGQAYPVVINGKRMSLSQDRIGDLIRAKLKKSPTIMAILQEFEMSPEQLDNLVIEIVPLEQKYAETDGESMRLNEFLFKEDFFEDYFFVVAHELVHWLSRKKEEESYFSDPEEVLGFTASVAYEIESGSDFDEIYNKVYPKISWHFNEEQDARDFFDNMIEKAQKLRSL